VGHTHVLISGQLPGTLTPKATWTERHHLPGSGKGDDLGAGVSDVKDFPIIQFSNIWKFEKTTHIHLSFIYLFIY
jgi:hypothetical protein